MEEEGPVGCLAGSETWKIQSGQEREVEGKSTLRSGLLAQQRGTGKEEGEEGWRAGRWSCNVDAGWGARWAW